MTAIGAGMTAIGDWWRRRSPRIPLDVVASFIGCDVDDLVVDWQMLCVEWVDYDAMTVPVRVALRTLPSKSPLRRQLLAVAA